MRLLSKSKILAYRQCHKRLWLEVHRPELKEESRGTETNYQVGHQVGDIARLLYDPDKKGYLIEPQELGFDEAFRKTSDLIQAFNPIFEATFTAQGALSLVDVMLPLNKQGKPCWRMIEVKSSTSVKDYHRDDIAVQAYITRSAGVPVKQVALACIDNSWVYPGQQKYQGLLMETDLTEEVFGREQEVMFWINESQAIISKRKEPSVDTGAHCSTPFDCGFYDYCSRNDPEAEYPVNWLPRIQSNALKDIIANGVIDMRAVPDELLSSQQLRVKQCTLSNEVYFDAKGAASDLSTTNALPAYFLDFETIQFAVPIWEGTRPYQQIPFQFSLHTLNRNKNITHDEFLDLSGNDPSLPFAEALINVCGIKGPVYVYNAAFEKTRIKELAERFTKLKKPLLAINDRIVDLWPIAKKHYYHPEQQGSWSIKYVLPTIAPELRYDELEGVQDGGMAMDAYLEAISDNSTTERKSEIRQQLLKYCGLDTFAMIRLWEYFTNNIRSH